MSWSLSKVGTQQEVTQYLDEVAPGAISHVQGVERSLADQALGLMRAVVAGETDPKISKVNLSAYGSASFGGPSQGSQNAQTMNISVSVVY